MSHRNGNGRGPSCKIETWSPIKAKKQLELNRDNRPISDSWVLELAQSMEAGEFLLNGESVKIAEDETLKDGQHRLSAIVLSGKTVQMLTVRGLPVDCFDTIDQGKRRTVGHILARHGEDNYNVLASAVTWVWKYENGAMAKTGLGGRPRPPQSVETLKRHPLIRESIPYGRTCLHLLRQGVGVAAHYLFSRNDQTLANDFFTSLASGESLTKGRGVYQLRERLIQNRTSKAKLGPKDTFALVIKAWNFERSGTRVKCLKWAENEEFPKIT